MKIIVGLGNFGDKYAYNFHNMGFLAAECLADRLGWKFDKRECSASLAAGYVKGEKVIIARPLIFMNLSGQAVKQLMAKYKAGEGDIAVIYDDIDLPKGTIRVREKGSAGTHNGMRNIIAEIKTENFRRIRIGIGKPPEFVPLADYVLSDVPKDERPLLASAIEAAADEAEKFIGVQKT